MFVPDRFWKTCIFLNYVFKRLFVWYIQSIDIFYCFCEFWDEVYFLLTIPDNSPTFFLNELFYDRNNDS